jgi:hypothetical protein
MKDKDQGVHRAVSPKNELQSNKYQSCVRAVVPANKWQWDHTQIPENK